MVRPGASRNQGRWALAASPAGADDRTMEHVVSKLIDVPDETRWFDHGRFDVVDLGGITLGRATLEGGWRWSTCIGRASGATSCPERHVGYMLQGRLMAQMDDGTRAEFVAGDAIAIPPGHDLWVLGEEEVVFLEVLPARHAA